MANAMTACDLQKIVFWVGAGISADQPSNLPLGGELTEYVLSCALGEKKSKLILGIWHSAERYGASNLREDHQQSILTEYPRLEAVLEALFEVENSCLYKTPGFRQAFSVFKQAPYNTTHYHLANLLRRGATIITTNFDTCIESAYNKLAGQSDSLIADTKCGIVCYRSKYNLPSVGTLWHIHGVAEDPDQLGNTIAKVKTGLPLPFQTYLDEIFIDGRSVIMLGYSASDSFDVNIYLSSRQKQEFPHSMINYWQHPSGNINVRRLEKLFHAFGARHYEYLQRTEVLLGLLSGVRAIPLSSNYDWKKSFRSAICAQTRKIIAPLLLCHICDRLGINVDIVESHAYAQAEKLLNVCNASFCHRVLASVGSHRWGGSAEKKHHQILSKDDPMEMLGYYYCIGDFTNAVNYAKEIDAIIEHACNPSKPLEWYYCTSAQAHCMNVMAKYLKNPFLVRPTKTDMSKLEKLDLIITEYAKRQYGNVRNVVQIAILLRHRGLICAIMGRRQSDSGSWYDLYQEMARCDGYPSIFITNACTEMLRARTTGDTIHVFKGFVAAWRGMMSSWKIGDLRRLPRCPLIISALIVCMIFMPAYGIMRLRWERR